jgi:hypothetical protein
MDVLGSVYGTLRDGTQLVAPDVEDPPWQVT